MLFSPLNPLYWLSTSFIFQFKKTLFSKIISICHICLYKTLKVQPLVATCHIPRHLTLPPRPLSILTARFARLDYKFKFHFLNKSTNVMQSKHDGEDGQQGSDDACGSCNNLRRRQGRGRGANFDSRGWDKNFPCRGENPDLDAGVDPVL